MSEENITQPENSENPQPVVEENSAIPKKKKFSNMMWLVTGLVLLIILGASGYFLLAGKTTQPSSETVVTGTPTPTGFNPSTANWNLTGYQGTEVAKLANQLRSNFSSTFNFTANVGSVSYVEKSTDGYLISSITTNDELIIKSDPKTNGSETGGYKPVTDFVSNYFKSNNGSVLPVNDNWIVYKLGKEECTYEVDGIWYCLNKTGDFQTNYTEQVAILKDIQKEGFDTSTKAIAKSKIDGDYFVGQILLMGALADSSSFSITSSPLLLKKVNGVWRILNDQDQPPSCKALAQKGFTQADQTYAGCINSY